MNVNDFPRLLEKFGNWLGTAGKGSRQRKRKSPQRKSPRLERLDDRRMLTTMAVIDFTGGTITAQQMEEGGWAGQSAKTAPSFRNMFNSSYPGLDMNGNGIVNSTDADLAVARIMDKVRTHYAPYDISVTAGDHSAYHNGLMNGSGKDVIVMIGGDDFISPEDPAFGWAPLDAGNQDSQYAFAFAKEYYDSGFTGDRFINALSRTISHEMAHTFGLEHVDGTDPHHLMSLPESRDWGHYFNFPDYLATTESGATQNAHAYLTQTLGESAYPWAAVLREGVLTVQGSQTGENLIVVRKPNGTWDVTAGGRHYYVNPTSNPDLESLNPYVGTSITTVVLQGSGGNDTIIAGGVQSAVTVYAFGGTGHDLLSGHDGTDYLAGNGDNDILLGLGGNDTLLGDAGNDVLIGGNGSDKLWGGANDDLLLGVNSTVTNSLSNLYSLRTAWTSSKSYSNRVADVDAIFATTSQSNDQAVDYLYGQANLDMFLYGPGDILDASSSESKRRFS